MGNRIVAQLTAAAFAGTSLLVLAAPANAASAPTDPDLESRSIVFVNGERRERDRPQLVRDADLTAAARRHAVRMADSGDLEHNANLGNEVAGFDRLAENVGVGFSIDGIDDAFMTSDGHRANILGRFHRIGLGVVERDGEVWVVQVFGHRAPQPSSANKAEQPKAKKTTKKPAKKKPAPKPQPRPEPSTSSPPASPEPESSPSSEPTPVAPEPTPEAPEPAPTPVEPTDDPAATGTDPEDPLDKSIDDSILERIAGTLRRLVLGSVGGLFE